jgi:hypothetical protein
VPVVMALLLVFTLSKAEVAKPITLKISNAIKPVTTAIKEAATTAINNTKTAIAIAKKDTVVKNTFTFSSTINEKPTGVKAKADSVFFTFTYNKPDTGKKSTFFIRAEGGKNGLDSMNFVLNGKKINSAEFKNIDPDKISAVNIVSQNAIDGLIGPDNNLTFDNDHNVLFITTSDSEAGKKLLEKLGKRRQLTSIRINGVNRAPGSLNPSEMATIAALPALTGPVSGHELATIKNLKGKINTVNIYSEKAKLNRVIVKGYSSKTDLKEVTVRGYGNKLYTTDSAVTVAGYGSGKLTTTYRSVQPAKTVIVKGFPSENRVYLQDLSSTLNDDGVISVQTIDRETGAVVTPVAMADKLYIIDGKEASEKAMKKLSAFDIDRINMSKDTDVIKKYGDKAKNGVIFIYTKKDKK